MQLTCLAKKIFSKRLSRTTDPAGSSSCTYLNKNINPWTGLKLYAQSKIEIFEYTLGNEYQADPLTYSKSLNCSASKLHSSST